MNIKQLRKVRILEIIREKVIRSQEDLLKHLQDEGFKLTQATLSRELKKLKVSKIASIDNSYRYIAPQESVSKPKDVRGFLSLNFSGNLAIIKTLAGYASPLAVLMDNNPNDIIKGTIAGRDTIFVALSESEEDRGRFNDYLNELLDKS